MLHLGRVLSGKKTKHLDAGFSSLYEASDMEII